MARRRLDLEMVRRGLAESREIAQSLIKSGKVLVSGSAALKSSRLVEVIRFWFTMKAGKTLQELLHCLVSAKHLIHQRRWEYSVQLNEMNTASLLKAR